MDDPMLAPVSAPAQVISTWKEALTILRARSTDIRIAYDQVLQAEAQERIALAALLPKVTANGTLTHNFITKDLALVGTSPAENTSNGNVALQQTILNLQQFYALGTAKEGTRGSMFSFEDTKRTLALSVANDIVGVITAERVAEINRVGLQQALSRLDLTVRKQKLGAATGLDVVRAQQDAETARTTLVSGDETLRKARESLGLALGIPKEVGVPRDIQIEGLERDAINSCRPADTIDARPDVLAARSKMIAADRGINDVWYSFFPTVSAASTVSTSTPTSAFAPPTTWNIQGVLSWTIWDGGARYGNLRNTRALKDQAEMTLESTRRSASIQVQQARRAVTVAADTLAVQARTRDLAVKNDELTQAAYREGTLTSLDLVTAAAARRQAEIQYALDEFNVVQARVAAILALATCDW